MYHLIINIAAQEARKRNYQEVQVDYDKRKADFIEKSIKRIRELKNKVYYAKTQYEVKMYNAEICSIKQGMKQFPSFHQIAPPLKVKDIISLNTKPVHKEKVYELSIEEITEHLKSNDALMPKLKVILILVYRVLLISTVHNWKVRIERMWR